MAVQGRLETVVLHNEEVRYAFEADLRQPVVNFRLGSQAAYCTAQSLRLLTGRGARNFRFF